MDEQAGEQQKLEQLKADIARLTTQLKQIGAQKDAKYKERDEFDKHLNVLIQEAKALRDQKKQIDEKIKTLKDKRQILNKEISELFKKLGGMRDGLPKADNKPKKSPQQLQKQIAAIQFSIETEALSFEREKKYMVQLKELKAQLAEINSGEQKYTDYKKFRDEVRIKKADADAVHGEVQLTAKQNSEIFRQLTEKSEQIAKIKEQKEKMKEEIFAFKPQIESVNTELSGLLEQWSAISPRPIAELGVEIPEGLTIEKIKEKKKITKEDLLEMQRQAMRRK
ncbi:MAG: hypothetical protein HY438_03355 [DPANN group archaeon]|nr:hypothetical protein [DPANN group archaeon]